MMLDETTPVLLTLDEEANLSRTLGQLQWAREVIVVDSFSRDATRSIAESFPNVRFFERRFDNHSEQWNFAIHETGIRTEWILALDADYFLPPRFVDEIRDLNPSPETAGYLAPFAYCIEGHPLRASLYPPVTVLFRGAGARYVQDGHTQRVEVAGRVGRLLSRIHHDDRKPFARWFRQQNHYMKLEARTILGSSWRELSWPDRIRRLRVVAPFAVLLTLLFGRGLLLDGWRGVWYALQRTLAEAVLSARLVEASFRKPEGPA